MSLNFQIRYHSAGRIVRLHLIGRIGVAERQLAAGQIVERFRHLKTLRLLVDTRYAELLMNASDYRTYVKFTLKHPVLRWARIAMLYRDGFSPMATAVQRIAGRGNDMRGFLVESEALEWLQQGDGRPAGLSRRPR